MELEAAKDVQNVEMEERTSTTSHCCSKEVNIVIQLRSVLLFLAATLGSAIVLELLPFDNSATPLLKVLGRNGSQGTSVSSPTFAIYNNGASEDHLKHVLKLLHTLGYQRTTIDKDWDLLWAHDYPYLRMPEHMKSLQSHQVVNHLPGCGFITNKVDLSTTPLPFQPRAFRLPAQREAFATYAREHPDALFVEKHNEHRHIVIRPPADINLNSNDSFVQEFVQNPFLVDGYKFDIGVYVLITSVDPLRIYIYTGDVLFRYCTVKYYPFDANNVDKYVVGDDYLPTWEVPSLVKYYQRFGGSMRAAFDAYVRDQALDPSGIWTQVEDIVRRTVLAKEQDIARLLRAYKTRNFFELLRFDLIIDDRLRVHLMEANMSPNLSSAHFKPNSLLYEQILYSVLNVAGIGTPFRRTSLRQRSDDIEEIITAEKNLVTDLNICVQNNCDKSCHRIACNLCLPCITGSEYDILERAQREHLHRSDMKRIFPKPIFDPENFDIEKEVQNMTKRNAWMARWFYGKCQYDRSWCY